MEHFPHTRVLRYPAIAEQDVVHRKKGEAMFPELKSLESCFPSTASAWSPASSASKNIRRSVRCVDKVGTEDGGAYTAAVLAHDMKDGTTIIEDVIRGQWAALEREKRIMQAAEIDRENYYQL